MTPAQWQEVKERFSEALGEPVEGRLAFLERTCANETVRSEVGRLLEEYDWAGDFLGQPVMDLTLPHTSPAYAFAETHGAADKQMEKDSPVAREQHRFGPYRLLRLLGTGGMGSVHLGERADGEVEQLVAIKFLHRTGHRSDFHDRFLQERQILAKLSHPGIARLLNAGHTEAGQPYLVMDYIDGVPIDDYADGLDLRGKLGLFIQVCEAVSYAHRSLVIHRDLKPSNIFVDRAGHPKLLDFGIAKILDDSLDETQTIDRVLTPQYASPEQLRGCAQTTATDIYSLGAVLYQLLTGKSPHALDGQRREEMSNVAYTKTPVAPSRLNPAVPRDLDFILGKALRKEPAERYPSVEAFADDIQAFLEWRPVRARSGDSWYHMRRFARRYRVAVAAVTLTIVGLSIGVFVVNRERQIAQHRFLQVRKLAKQFIELDGAVKQLPGSTKVRSRIVSESLEYLAALSEEARKDPDLAFEIGYAYLQVARVQGVPTGANLGQFAEAEESLKKADSLVAVALAANAEDRRAILTSAEISHDRMALMDMQGRAEEAIALARITDSRLSRLFTQPSHDSQEIITASRIYGDMGLACDNNNRFQDALRYCRRAELISQSKEGPHSRGVILGAMTTALLRSGDLNGALQTAHEHRSLVEDNRDGSPMVKQQNLANALDGEGVVLGSDETISLGRWQEALDDFEQAVKLSEALAKSDPDDASSRMLLARVAGQAGDILRHTNPQAALAIYDHALKRVRETKMNALRQDEEAGLLTSSSYAARWLHRTDDARQRINRAFQILRETDEYPADKIEPLSEPDRALRALADHYAETGEAEKAVATYKEELEKLSAWKTDPHEDLQTADVFSHEWTGISRILEQAGQREEAALFEARRTELWDRWNNKLPGNPFVLRQLALLHPSSSR